MTTAWEVATRMRERAIYLIGINPRSHETPGAGNFLPEVLHALSSGELFSVSEPIAEVVYSASQSIPDDWVLHLRDLPATQGIVFFENALEGVRIYQASNTRLVGITWSHAGYKSSPSHPGLVVWGFFTSDGSHTYYSCIDWELGTQIKAPNDHIPEESYKEIRFAASLLQFVKQTILVSTSTQPDRATRRRYEKAGEKIDPTSVIHLRKKIHQDRTHQQQQLPPEGLDEKKQVEWACQWLVRGHWRNQYYPKTQTHRIRWIFPYVKGPDNKPLRSSNRVFTVSR